MHGVLGDSEQFAIVSLYELPEGSDAPILAGTDKIQVIATVLTASCAESAAIFIQLALESTRFVETIDAARKWKAVSVGTI